MLDKPKARSIRCDEIIMNIDKMEAGPDMNALVAEKIPGWRRSNEYAELGIGDKDIIVWVEPDQVPSNETWNYLRVPPDYSGSMAAAWDIVEKLSSRGLGFQIMSCYPPGWMAWFGGGAGLSVKEIDVQGFAETAPLAISRAALKAVML